METLALGSVNFAQTAENQQIKEAKLTVPPDPWGAALEPLLSLLLPLLLLLLDLLRLPLLLGTGLVGLPLEMAGRDFFVPRPPP